MCRRAGFDIVWDNVPKEDYLVRLTRAVALREYGDLHELFTSLIVEPPDPDETRAKRLAIKTTTT